MNTQLLLHTDSLNAVEAYLHKPAQSLLLAGKQGNGKATLAREVAAELLGCSLAMVEQHPYVRVIEPADGKIAIETIRSLASFVQLVVPGNAAVRRAICICDADTMTREAQNSLLKLLEEPPEHTVVILTASQPRRLLPTIRSRVQTMRVTLPSDTSVAQVFVEKGYDHRNVEKAMLLADGSYAALQSALESGESAGSVLHTVKQILTADTFTRLTYVDTELKDKDKARSFVDTLATVASASLHKSGVQQLQRWQRILTAAVTAQKALGQNGNQKLVLTELMLSL